LSFLGEAVAVRFLEGRGGGVLAEARSKEAGEFIAANGSFKGFSKVCCLWRRVAQGRSGRRIESRKLPARPVSSLTHSPHGRHKNCFAKVLEIVHI
jgi:hypothetical protein